MVIKRRARSLTATFDLLFNELMLYGKRAACVKYNDLEFSLAFAEQEKPKIEEEITREGVEAVVVVPEGVNLDPQSQEFEDWYTATHLVLELIIRGDGCDLYFHRFLDGARFSPWELIRCWGLPGRRIRTIAGVFHELGVGERYIIGTLQDGSKRKAIEDRLTGLVFIPDASPDEERAINLEYAITRFASSMEGWGEELPASFREELQALFKTGGKDDAR